MNPLRIIHVAQIAMEPTTGMGRIACEWQAAARRNGHDFIHVGTDEVGPVFHRYLFPVKARKMAERLMTDRTVLLVHEPSGWAFRGMPCTKVAFSHGIELRSIAIEREFHVFSPKRKVTRHFVSWMGKQALLAMDRILVSNTDDQKYLAEKEIMPQDRVRVFRNGVDPVPVLGNENIAAERNRTIVFNAAWLSRKGIHVLIKAASLLAERGIRPLWLLMGSGFPAAEVRADWPETLWGDLMIIPKFQREDEFSLLSRASIYVLPSYFEGQPLSLLQAMTADLCCITTDCCGQKDVIQHGENGLLFPQGDHVKLAELVQRVWENPALRSEMATKARASMGGRTWPAVTDEIMGWLKDQA